MNTRRSAGPARLVRPTLRVAVGQGARLVLQLAYYFLLARALGASEFGRFATAVAAASLAAPFASMGGAHLLTRHVARGTSSLKDAIGHASGAISVGAVPATLLLVFTVPFLTEVPMAVMVVVGGSELLLVRLLDLAHRSALAIEESRFAARLLALQPGFRLAAVLLWLWWSGDRTASTWSVAYVVATAAGAATGLVAMQRRFGWARPRFDAVGESLRYGFPYAVTDAAHNINNDVDRSMLAVLRTALETGIYSVAARLIDAALLPLRALGSVAYPSFFREGAAGIGRTASFAAALLPLVTMYGALVGIGAWVLAPYIPSVLGEGYASAVTVLRWLAPVVLARGVAQVAADALSGAGRPALRGWLQATAAAVNVGLNVWLIPNYGLEGVVWATLVSDYFVAVALWIAVIASMRRAGAP